MRRLFATRLAIATAVIVVAMSALFAAQRVRGRAEAASAAQQRAPSAR